MTTPVSCTALLRWVRARRGPLLAHVDGAREAVRSAPTLPGTAVTWSDTDPGAVTAATPVAVCTDRWLNSLPSHAPGTTAPYSRSRTGTTRIVHVRAANGQWIYVVDSEHVIDPAFLRGADLGGWVVHWPD